MVRQPLTMEFAALLLAREAKRLTEGMMDRVKRTPDIADYHTAFLNALRAATVEVPAVKVPAVRR